MKLTLAVRMDWNRRSLSSEHPAVSRRGDRWVGAILTSGTSCVSARLNFRGEWEVRADAEGGTNVMNGRLGSNELAHRFEFTRSA